MQSDGRLKRVRAHFPTKAEAQNHLAFVRSKKALQRLGFAVPEVKKSERTFEEFAKEFIAKHSLGRPETRRCHQTCLTALLNSKLFKEKRLTEINTEAIAKYHAERGAEHLFSANRELGFLKLILRRAVDWGELSDNPAARVKKFPEPRTRRRFLSDDEVVRLLEAARLHEAEQPRLRPLLMLLLTTGMRPKEAFKLHWAYDGWEAEKKLTLSIVSITKRLIFIPSGLAKNHKDREVPLSPELVSMFDSLPRDLSVKRTRSSRHKKHGEPQAEPLSPRVFPWGSAPKCFRAAVDEAKLKNVTIYTLKHTAASCMVRAGIDIVTVCELLGHADIKTTMIYCHSSPETKREAVARVSRIYLRRAKTKAAPSNVAIVPKLSMLTN
jgi:site-specific recombinase XerD